MLTLPQTTFSFLLYFVRQQWRKFSVLMLISVTWAFNDTFFPFFLKKIINVLHNDHGANVYQALRGTLILLVLFWLLTEALTRFQGILSIYTFPKLRASIRETVFNYVKSHSHEYFSNQFAGTIAKKLADLPSSAQTMMEITCYQFVTAMTGVFVVFAMMWSTRPIFGLILLTWLILHLGLAFIFLRYSNRLWEIHSDAVSTLSGKYIDIFTNILTTRLFARGSYEVKYVNSFQEDEIKKAQKAMWLIEIMRIGFGLSGLFLIFSMIFTLVYGWTQHWITLGDFTQVGMQSFWLLGWIWFSSFQLNVFAREAGTISDALSLVRKAHDVVDEKEASNLVIKSGDIQFEQVNFAYRKNNPLFNQLNVSIPAGQKVGLVGFSGSGKSTFVNLILRYYDIQSGRILIAGQDIAQVTQNSLRQQIGMIPQEPTLFHRSLMENIRYGRLEATDEEVIRASKLAHCHEFIEKLDEVYEALVGERGIKLSGGQRQRIAIARAILKDAPILILDEATSSLDSVTEKLIQDSLHQLMHGKTTIVVAHRLSTLNDMDRILVFDKGRIIEDGTKEDLLKAGKHFALLWDMQTHGFLPEVAGEQ